MEADNGDVNWDKLAILSYEVKPYETLGMTVLGQADTPQMNPAAEAALDLLAEERNYQTDLQERVQILLNGSFITETQRRSLVEARDFPLRRNMAKIRRTADYCLNNPTRCPLQVEETLQALETIDGSILIIKPSFFTQCQAGDSTTEFGKTVNALLGYVQEQDCLRAEGKLLALTDINLKGKGLKDTTALRYLRPQKLDLSYNQITDMRPLNLMSSLVSLNIRDNLIDDMHIVRRWPQLQNLNAGFNRIKTASDFADQNQIRRLVLHGNLFPDGDLLRPGNYEYLSLTVEERCARERDIYLKSGKINRQNYEYYTDVDFAPIVENSSVRWAACRYAARSYPE
jgi:hypothetical protein